MSELRCAPALPRTLYCTRALTYFLRAPGPSPKAARTSSVEILVRILVILLSLLFVLDEHNRLTDTRSSVDDT